MKQRRKNRFLYKMVAAYTLVFGLILMVIFTLLYFILMSGEQSRNELNHQIMVEQPLKQVERFVDEMDDIAYKAMTNQQLIAQFSFLRQNASDPDARQGNYFEFNVMADIDTASILAGINRGVTPSWRLSAYNDKDDFIYTGATLDRSRVQEIMQRRGVGELMQNFRDMFVEINGDPGYLLYPPQNDPWSPWYQSKYVSLIRPIMNVYSGDVLGIVEVQQNLNRLRDYLQLSAETNLVTNLYDQYGSPILVQGGEDYVVMASAVSEQCGWRVELLEPASVMQGTRMRYMQLLLVVWLSLTAVMALVIGIIATRISKPLTELTDKVRTLDIANPQEIPQVPTKIDEIIALQAGFNQVLNSLTFSLDQEKKAFLLAMQAQMNPHFLYNVLSVINAVALEGRSDSVVDICANLSGMLRYSSSYTEGTATVRQEVEHTREYLELMKARYTHMFHYSIAVDPALEQTVIPKLVIQPICENAFTHPFSKMEPPYELDIRVCTEEEGWSITVTDNGDGFDEAERLRVMEKANNTSYDALNQLKIGGLGLVSTVLRLKLLTKRRVVCSITQARPKGSVVKIMLLGQEDAAEGDIE